MDYRATAQAFSLPSPRLCFVCVFPDQNTIILSVPKLVHEASSQNVGDAVGALRAHWRPLSGHVDLTVSTRLLCEWRRPHWETPFSVLLCFLGSLGL